MSVRYGHPWRWKFQRFGLVSVKFLLAKEKGKRRKHSFPWDSKISRIVKRQNTPAAKVPQGSCLSAG
jgi:hypothetical protein|nr:MAG TPA: hypothetical protein [Caudoviricetes sp.]